MPSYSPNDTKPEVNPQDSKSGAASSANWGMIGSGAGDILGAVGSVFSIKYQRDYQRKAFWLGVADARRVLMSDYAALYRRSDEEAQSVANEIDMLSRSARVVEGEIGVAAGAAGLSGNSIAAIRENATRSALLQEGIARRNQILVNNQINAELDAARWRARARMLDSAGGPSPAYGSSYVNATVGALKILGGAL